MGRRNTEKILVGLTILAVMAIAGANVLQREQDTVGIQGFKTSMNTKDIRDTIAAKDVPQEETLPAESLPASFYLRKLTDTCTKTCNKLKRLVCGTDGVTYFNPCQFTCAKKHKPDLRIAHQGAC